MRGTADISAATGSIVAEHFTGKLRWHGTILQQEVKVTVYGNDFPMPVSVEHEWRDIPVSEPGHE